MSKHSNYNVTERVGIAVSALHRARRPIPTSHLAKRVGITRAGAWAMLAKLSAVLPLTQDSDGWFLVDDE